MMKTRKKRIIVITAIVVVLIATCSSGLMLRAAVFIHSPKSAVTMEYKEITTSESKGTLYTITKNAPVEKGTEAELTTWVVYNLGPFHYAKYYGEA